MKYILVTGAASGIGKMITEAMARRDWIVFAADVNEEAMGSLKRRNIIPIFMDVTKEKSIEDAYRKVAKETIYLDIIINSAGLGSMSSLIEENIDKIQSVLDVNLFGTARVNKMFFPLLSKETGRIINISCECGWMSPSPFNGPYNISKHALEAYNDTLRRELNILGIKVIKIQPGSFKTPMHKKTISDFKDLVDNTKFFKYELKMMSKIMRKELKNINDPKYLISAIVDACESPRPKICYRVKTSRNLRFINSLPERLIDLVYLKK